MTGGYGRGKGADQQEMILWLALFVFGWPLVLLHLCIGSILEKIRNEE